MLEQFLQAGSLLVLNAIDALGYLGVFILMTLESANIPIPSEIIMPFSGFLVTKGTFSFWAVVVVGSLGNLVGSWISYFIAIYAKSRFQETQKSRDYLTAEKWFKRFGEASILIGRIVPIIRTFISFPAGFFKVKFWKFTIWTLIGSFLWTLLLTYIGFFLGENWNILGPYFKEFDYVIAGVLGVGFILWLWHHFRKR